MTIFWLKHLILLHFILIFKSYCFELDITKKVNYTTLGKRVEVNKLDLQGNVYNHFFEEPLLLSDIVENGESVLFDKLFFREQPVSYATVFWENNDPSIVHLYTDLSTVVLYNNGNGRFFEESILSEKFVTNSTTETHPSSQKQVTLNLSHKNNYHSSGTGVHVTEVHKFDEGLNPYKVHYQNVDNFRVNGLTYNNVQINVPLDDDVHGVYLYSKDDNPILVEVVSTTSSHKYYVKGPGGTWEHFLLPSIYDPLYNHYFLKKLKANDTHCNNNFVLDLSQTTTGRHPFNVTCVVKGRNKTFEKFLQVNNQSVQYRSQYRRHWLSGTFTYNKITYELENRKSFRLDGLRYNNSQVTLQLPTGPYTTVTVYFYKCPVLIKFTGPNTNTFYQYERCKQYKVYTPKNPNDEKEILNKYKEIHDHHSMKSIFYSC